MRHPVTRHSRGAPSCIHIDEQLTIEHYAYLVGEEEFDRIFERIQARGMSYWGRTGCTSSRAASITTTTGAASIGTTPTALPERCAAVRTKAGTRQPAEARGDVKRGHLLRRPESNGACLARFDGIEACCATRSKVPDF